MTPHDLANHLATSRLLGPFLAGVSERFGNYTLLAHWQQGEFHHDVVIAPAANGHDALAPVVVVATNCNAGIKEVVGLDAAPDRWALWHARCPTNAEFHGAMPSVRFRVLTEHWFDPCELLTPDARSELKPEHRRRMRGGGWERT